MASLRFEYAPLALATGAPKLPASASEMNRMRSLLLILLLALSITVPVAARAQVLETVFADIRGQRPSAELVQGPDGLFYGTTEYGGAYGHGTVFKMTPEGELTTLASFNNATGQNPAAGVVQGSDGAFYGTTRSGGANGIGGTVFKMTPEGRLTTLVSFNDTNGRSPTAGLIEGSDGSFYGTTLNGGTSSHFGTVFKITPAGELTTLVRFNSLTGRYPAAGLVQGSDGNFYGTTLNGGAGNYGTIFKMTPAGELTVLVSFDGSNGSSPRAGLVQGADGNFYGTTETGGPTDEGTIFKVTPAGALTTLVFCTAATGSKPFAGLVRGIDGNLYGTTAYGGAKGLGTIFRVTTEGVFTTLASSDELRARRPMARLVQGTNGSFYGTSPFDGTSTYSGSIFKVTTSGELTTLITFSTANGRSPRGGLLRSNDGTLYGTTQFGGANGLGTVFKVTPDGEHAVIASFSDSNGSVPQGTLLEGDDGNLYGTTSGGGQFNYGSVFKVTPSGVLTTVASFNHTNGRMPIGGLIKGSDGNFYGTTKHGGPSVPGSHYADQGSVFKVTPAGVITTLVPFAFTNGSYPVAGLVEGADGNFYGTTREGGSTNCGTVFRVTPAGEHTVLLSLRLTDHGANPSAELLRGNDGNLYGTSIGGGSKGGGTIFRISPAGVFTKLVDFDGTNGRKPLGGLVEGGDGNLYGTTSEGGANNKGTIFRMTPAGELATLHSFDGLTAAPPEGTPAFGIDGKLYGAASQIVIWRLSIPMHPGITGSSHSSLTKSGVTLNGLVNSNGEATTVTFEYGSTPALGNSIPATPGTVTGRGATAVNAILSGLALKTTYYYRLTASNVNGAVSTEVFSVTTNDNAPPVAANDSFSPVPTSFGAFSINVLENDSDADGDPVTITAVTQGSFGSVTTNGSKLTYTPGAGFVGRDTFSYTVSDGLATATAQVELRATEPFMRILFAKSSEVPGAGQEGSEIPAGSLFTRFGVTAINSAGNLALTASYAVPGDTDELSVLVLDPQAQGSRLAARQGLPAPGTAGALFASFKDPLLNEAGDVAFLATLSGGDAKKSSNQGIWIHPGSATSSAGTELVARTGAQAAGAPSGARWKSFTSVAFSSGVVNPQAAAVEGSWTLAFTGFMATGSGGVKANNDMGLWLASPGRTVLALRERQTLEVEGIEKQIRTFAALKSLPGAPAQGGGVTNEGGVAAQVFFTDGSQAILRVSDNEAGENIAIDVLALPGDTVAEASETSATFGIPAQSDSGTATAWIGTLSGKGKPTGVFERNLSDSELLHVLARKGGTAPGIDGATFSVFTNVAVNDSGSALFLAKVRGSGISKANDEGLWWRKSGSETAPLQLLAREGLQPPGLGDGAKWHSFSSVALPEGTHGPLFTARLKSASYGHMGQGLWVVDSAGELRLIIREGQNVPTEENGANVSIKSFTILSAAPGSPTQRRSYNDSGRIVFHVVFDGAAKAEGIITVQLP